MLTRSFPIPLIANTSMTRESDSVFITKYNEKKYLEYFISMFVLMKEEKKPLCLKEDKKLCKPAQLSQKFS